jgi:hypothetical protein
MWCPPEFRRIHSHKRSQQRIDKELYDAEWVKEINIDK